MTSSLDRWYSPGAIKYTPTQIRYFILPFLDDLEIGEWPPRPQRSGYSTAIVKPPFIAKEHAGFVPAVEVAAELTARMACLPPPAAAAMLEVYGYGTNYYDYAYLHNMTDYGLRQLLKDAVDYCSGEARKMQTYKSWQTERAIDKLWQAIQTPAESK